MFTKDIYIVKDLRNAIAHDKPIYDRGFRRAGIDQGIARRLGRITGTRNITFGFIVDYVLLLV